MIPTGVGNASFSAGDSGWEPQHPPFLAILQAFTDNFNTKDTNSNSRLTGPKPVSLCTSYSLVSLMSPQRYRYLYLRCIDSCIFVVSCIKYVPLGSSVGSTEKRLCWIVSCTSKKPRLCLVQRILCLGAPRSRVLVPALFRRIEGFRRGKLYRIQRILPLKHYRFVTQTLYNDIYIHFRGSQILIHILWAPNSLLSFF